MSGKSLDLKAVTSLLQDVATGKYEIVDPQSYGDPGSVAALEIINQLHGRQESMLRDYSENLQRSETRLRSIIETTPVGICITNEDRIYEYVNPTYCKLYGYTNDELVGNSFTMVVPPEHRKELVRLHDEFMGRRYELRGEWSVLRKDGSPMEIIADAAYIIDIDGRPKKVTFVLDISERKAAEETLRQTVDRLNQEIQIREQLEQIKVRVERMIRHDLRNPLNGIMAAAEIIMTDDIPTEQRDLCELIMESGRKLDSMLSSGVDLIKMEEGTYQLRPRKIDLGNIIAEARRELASTARRSGVKVVARVGSRDLEEDAGLIVEGEALYLSELFANLVRNAIEASAAGDTVTIRLTREGDTYSVAIHNRAVIPEDIRGVFFHPYATSGKAHGTGLGTYVAALITRVHHGEIKFTSTEEAGTTITVTLPEEQKKTDQQE